MLLLCGLVPAVLAVSECAVILGSLSYDSEDADLDLYLEARGPRGSALLELSTACTSRELPRRRNPATRIMLPKWRRFRRGLQDTQSTRAGALTLIDVLQTGQDGSDAISDGNARRYRWWRATLNQHAVQRLTLHIENADELLAELTLFVGLVRRSNWIVIDELNMAYLNAVWLFGVQLVVWIVALIWVIIQL